MTACSGDDSATTASSTPASVSGAVSSAVASAEQHADHSSLLVGDQDTPEGFVRTDLTAEFAETADLFSVPEFPSLQGSVTPEECAALSTSVGDVFPLLGGDAPSAAIASFADDVSADSDPGREIMVFVDTSGALGAPVDMDIWSEFTRTGGEGDYATTMRYTAESRDLEIEGADSLVAAQLSTSVEDGEMVAGGPADDATADIVVGTVGNTTFLVSSSVPGMQEELDTLAAAQVRTLSV
ncbi:hypothetical protein PQI66_11405 [Corynebacterium sp. USCH3]|uniref:hypothetical protein n=1 Tax=Corynebacterium sp. USCH3 TaxID=3024840 RepID=UPI0030A16933